MQIFPGSITGNFLNQTCQQYKIPVYQRNYEWSWEQCDKLFEDIVQAAKRNHMHFCGSIVFQPIAPVKGVNNSIIIDGQQRLTTIYILIKALCDMAQNESEKILPEGALYNKDQFNQLQLDETTKLKLKPAKENNDQLLALIYDEHDKLDKSCEIYRNYVHFCDLIRKEQLNGVTVSDIYRGISMLLVAVIQLDSNDKAQEIFERINSTGIPLNLADKIRNYVLMTDDEQDRLYDEYWLVIEKLLPRDQLADFFMDFLNFKLDGFTKESTAYDDFKQIYHDGNYSNEKMLDEMRHYAEQYYIFYHGDQKLSEDVNNALDGLRKLKQTTVYLFLFRIFDDYENGVIDQKELGNILNLLLNYSIRRLICEIGSNSLRGLYKTLYARVFNRPENKERYYDAIVSFLLQLTTKDAIPSDTDFILALKERNLYRKNALCKYLLSSIENQGKEKIIVDNLSIEHILPQNKNLSTAWQKMLGENWEEVRDRYLHTLGNLTLTGYNSELGDRPFDEKKEMIEKIDTHVTILYTDVGDKEIWNAKAIEDRAQRLADIIIDLFPIIEPEEMVRFYDPRYQEYTVADPTNATFKYVNYYELLGERVNVDSFAVMVRSVARKLYDLDDSIIKNLASSQEIFFSGGYPMFAYDENVVKKAIRLKKDDDIYMSSGYSAHDCVCIIRELLKKHELDVEEDFVYSARPTQNTQDLKMRLEAAKAWCEKHKAKGDILFDVKHSKNRYVRFTTPLMNSYIPDTTGDLSPWKTANFYFYEITYFKGELFIQMSLYCKGLTDEMTTAVNHLIDILHLGKLAKGYMHFFESSRFECKDSDTAETIVEQLDVLFAEVKSFEAIVKERWQAQ